MDYTYGIVGLGIMGGSIARAIRTNIIQADKNTNNRIQIFAMDKNEQSLSNAMSEQIIDQGFSPEETQIMLKQCDFVFICLYPHATVEFLKANINNFKDNSIITDISGVKAIILENFSQICPENADFIPGHPMAGGEKEGFSNSKGEYFKNHNYIIIEDKNLSAKTNISLEQHKKNIQTFENLIYKMGFSRITKTDCSTHDLKIGFTSQLCHVVASAMVESASDEQITSFGGGSFEDLTRIAMINAPLWTELFICNKEKLVEHINSFKSNLELIKNLIIQEDEENLKKLLEDVRKKRINMN